MHDQSPQRRYNYDAFTPEKISPWMNFESSPALGEKAPDFPLWDVEGTSTTLGEIWSASVENAIAYLLQVAERRARGERMAPFRVERLDYRESDRDKFFEGLARSGPKAV